jgi:organic hydroperoxide reductase OsmC/OhrA
MATRDTLTPKEAQCSGGADYAALALEALQEPADAAYAKELMDRVAGDCQFTKDLAACAIVYKALGEQDRAEELLQTAEDYCMSGEEQVALAEAKFKVLGDKAAAVGAYEKALKETGNLDPLIDLAKNVMSVIADSAFAKKVLEKAEAKISRAVEYSKLAAASVEHLLDKEYAAAIFNKAADKLSSVPDLLALAGEVTKTLGDPQKAKALYERALAGATDFTAARTLIESAKQAGDATFMQAALKKAGDLATATGEYIELAEGLAGVGDKPGAAALLDKAEDAVAGLDEMQKLVAAVEAHLADDAERLTRVRAKLEKRQANHARYLEFQQLEKDATSVKQLLTLATRVRLELEDPFYAAKLIESAEKMLDGTSYQFSRYKPILLAVDQNLDDTDWLGRLLDRAAENATDSIAFKDLAATAAHLKHRELGISKARAYLAARESALAATPGTSVYDYAKLAEASFAAKDTEAAGRLLEAARSQAKDHFALTHIGRLYASVGNSAKADELFAAAAAACSTGDTCIQFIDRLKGFALPAEALKRWYAECGTHLNKSADKLRWAEGIADALNDKTWATEVYGQLAGQFSGADAARFELSRRSRADLNYFGAKRRH